MAYDAGLETRIDDTCADWPHYTKKKMFGGIGYLHAGNMAFGIWKDNLVVRCGAERQTESLSQPHTLPFDVTSKAMTGWIMVEPPGFSEDDALSAWLELGRGFAGSLPPKPGY